MSEELNYVFTKVKKCRLLHKKLKVMVFAKMCEDMWELVIFHFCNIVEYIGYLCKSYSEGN